MAGTITATKLDARTEGCHATIILDFLAGNFLESLRACSPRGQTMKPLRARMKFWTPVILTTAFWLGGCTCTGSLRPLQSDESLTNAPDLSGKWVSDDGNKEKELFLVEKTTEGEYRVSNLVEDEKLQVVYRLSLVQVGSYTFFDVAFEEVNFNQKGHGVDDLGVLPIHFIGRVWTDGNTLRLGLLDYEWIRKMTSDGQLTVPFIEQHENDDNVIFLTAGADDLRDFVRQYAEDPAAFSQVLTFHRATSQ
jgi:hypothetical protein